ncbi:MAG: dockerin type I repeat-containing protein [Oscillibacter sp.]|nr:dockerin type I repeat-containing protein [Oscillibacter sp.]
MKKSFMQLALILGLMTLACVTAWAAESDPEAEPTFGFMNIKAESSFVTLTALDDSEQSVTASTEDEAMFPGAVKIGVTCTNMQSGKEYLLIVQSGDNNTPNVDDMVFIDQKAPTSDGTQTNFFVIYPKKPSPTAESVQYTVYMSSNADTSTGITQYEKVGSFEYYSTAPDVLLGDVDGNGSVTIADVSLLLDALNEKETLDDKQTAAADVDGNGVPAIADVGSLLDFLNGKIASFEELRNQS